MSNVSRLNLKNVIDKPFLKKRLRQIMINSGRHQMLESLDNKSIARVMYFLKGYLKCIEYHGIQPINTSELQDLLVREAYDFIEEYTTH